MLPQVTKNIRVSDKAAVRDNKNVISAVKAVGEGLGKSGRVLLRESGTEPLIRIMVEAPTEELCRLYTEQIADVIISEGLA